MKQTMRIWLALVLALYAGTTAWAIRSYTYTLAGGTLENCDLNFSGDYVAGRTAEAGTTVTITVIPYNGYATKGITIKTYMNTGDMQARNRSQIIEEITPQSTEDPNVFTITMPAANVIVSATTTRVVQAGWIQIQENQPEQTTYTGSPLTPAIAVMDGETQLNEETDYDVSYSNNEDAALSNAENAPTVTITGKGNYSGTASKTFTIEKATPVISDQPEADVITYGQELGESGWLTQPPAINPISSIPVMGSYAWSNPNIVPSVSDSQNTEYEVTFTPNDNNYNKATTKIKVTVNPASMTEGITVTPYEAPYDGSSHGITVELSGVAENATVKYRTSETGDYDLTDCPTYSDAGEYTIYYQVTKENYYTEGGSATVIINKATATISYATTEMTSEYGDDAFTNELSMDPATGTGLGNVIYASNNEAVATIDPSTGEVTITGAGSATITATVTDGLNYTYSSMEGYDSDSETASVNYILTVNPVSLEGATVTLSQDSYDYDGTDKEPAVLYVTLNDNTLAETDYSVTYSNNTNAAESTDENAPTVTITGMGNYVGEITKTFTINPKSLTNDMIQTIAGQNYIGSELTPEITVMDGETGLTLDTDYSVSYSNNTDAAESNAENAPTVTITGMGNYTGTASQTFTIEPKFLTNDMIQTIAGQNYTGSELTPEITVMDGETGLTLDTDYSVSYSNNSDAAESTDEYAPTVTITGIGNYTGTASKTFTINKATATISYATTPVSKAFGDDAFTNALTITGDGTVEYAVTAETPNEGCLTVATIDPSTGEVTITGAGSATITATVTDGDNYTYSGMDDYDSYSETASVNYTLTVDPVSLQGATVTLSPDNYYYYGTGKGSVVLVFTLDGRTLVDTDYSVTYSNNTNAAESTDENAPTGTITGMGNYTCTASQTFTINRATATISYATTPVSKAFGDDAFTNALTITGDGTVEYAVTAETPNEGCLTVATIDPSTGEVTITGAGSATITATVTDGDNYTYSGMDDYDSYSETASVNYTLTVDPVSLQGATVTLSPDNYYYDGTDKEPAVLAVTLNGNTLADTDYSVTYSNNTNAAESTDENAPTVTITGMGNYTGTASQTFTINRATATISYATTPVSKAFGDNAFTNALTNTGDGTVEYAVTDETPDEGCPNVATINEETGEVTITGTGSATITATVADNDNYTYGGTNTATYTLTVTKGTITASATGGSYSYSATGSHAITVSVTKPSSGYTIMYGTTDGSYEQPTNPSYSTIGTYTTYYKVSAPNYNDFTGQATVTVNAASLTGATVTLSQTSYDYDGTAKEPAVSAVTLNGTELASSDYTVSYSDNVNAGTATVTVIGRGNYTGTASQTFTINSVSTTDENITVVEGGSETVLTIDDRGIQQGKTVTPDLQVTTLNYTRSLNASSANAYTVCLPYAPSTDANLKYYTLTGCEGTTLLFDEISGAPQAYTPYLVFASSTTDIGTENLKQTITMSQTVSNSSSAGNYVMKGTLSGFSHEQSVGKYILQSGNRWGQVDSDPNAYIPPFRAYIEATTNGARMLDSSFGGEATGINSLRTIDRDGTERYFDLNGRRIENPKKAGVYIRNGRKEVMK